MQTATSGTESNSLDLSICVHHFTSRAPFPKGEGIVLVYYTYLIDRDSWPDVIDIYRFQFTDCPSLLSRRVGAVFRADPRAAEAGPEGQHWPPGATPRLVKVALLDLKAVASLHKLYPSPANPVRAWEAVTATRGGRDKLRSRLARRHADLLQDRRIRGPSSCLPPHGRPPTTPSSHTPART